MYLHMIDSVNFFKKMFPDCITFFYTRMNEKTETEIILTFNKSYSWLEHK